MWLTCFEAPADSVFTCASKVKAAVMSTILGTTETAHCYELEDHN